MMTDSAHSVVRWQCFLHGVPQTKNVKVQENCLNNGCNNIWNNIWNAKYYK